MENENSNNNSQGWSSLGLSQKLSDFAVSEGYPTPTPVQEKAIPQILKNNDMIVSSRTGSGKTACFVLPIVERLSGREGTFCIVLSPTREIALQTQAVFEKFGAPFGVRSIAMIGGVDMRVDIQAIQSYPQVIVATPGRLCDHLERGNIWLEYIQFVVLDEADRMLDMGFHDQLIRVLRDLPENRQTLLFSATFPVSVDRLAKKMLYKPVSVNIGQPLAPAAGVAQFLRFVREEEKMSHLRNILHEEKGSVIVFTRSKDSASRLWRSLHSHCIFDAAQIHSDLSQASREAALEGFKKGSYRILVATDVAGRGIHVDAVSLVVNYDLPREAEDYIHRIGRTGRMNAQGKAISFVTSRDRVILQEIEKCVGKRIAHQ